MNHTRTRRWAAGAAITTLLTGVLSLVLLQPASANHPDGSTLQVVKELNTVGVGGTITLRAYISNGPVTSPLKIAFELEGGPATVKSGLTALGTDPSTETADVSCTIGTGFSSCDLPLTATTSGTGLIRAWVDHDGKDFTAGGIAEADVTEKRLANTSPLTPLTPEADCRFGEVGQTDTRFDQCTTGDAGEGSVAEPDITDVVQVAWSDSPSNLDCFDSNGLNGSESETNKRNENENYTCRVRDSSGNLVKGAQVDGENLNGANDPDDGTGGTPDYDTTDFPPEQVNKTDTTFCTTDDSGTCAGTVSGAEGQVGGAKLCFWLDNDNDEATGTNADDGGDCSETVPTEDADATDTVDILWSSTAPVATNLDVTPEESNVQAGSSPSVTATIYDQYGDPFVGTTAVSAEYLAGSVGDVDGSAAPRDTVCSTSNTSSCGIPVRSTSAGEQWLCAWIGSTTPTYAGSGATATCEGEATGTETFNRVDVVHITWFAAPATTTTTTTTTAPGAGGGGAGGGGGGGGGAATPQGYSLVGADGSLYAFGTAKNFGDMKGTKLNAPIIGVAYTPGGNGYWLVAKDGGIFSFGNADFYGSMGDQKLNAPVLGMAATPTGKGYWLFAGDGGIFSFGDATFYGSRADQPLNKPIIQMEPLASGGGYWLVAEDGGIFSYGQATFHGSRGAEPVNQPIFDMTSTDTDQGYWLIARDGGVFSYGDAETKFYGNPVNDTNPKPTRIVGMDSSPSSTGYWIADATGKVWNYGDAQALGDRYGAANPAPMIAFASVPR